MLIFMKDRLWLCNWRPTGVEKWQVVIFSVLHWRHWRAQPKIREKNTVSSVWFYICIGCIGKWTNMNHTGPSHFLHMPKIPQDHGFPETQSCNLTISYVAAVRPPICHDSLPAATLPSSKTVRRSMERPKKRTCEMYQTHLRVGVFDPDDCTSYAWRSPYAAPIIWANGSPWRLNPIKLVMLIVT